MGKGKYADLTPRLPKYQEKESYQDKVQVQKDEYLTAVGSISPSCATLTHDYIRRRTFVEGLKKQLYDAQVQLEAMVQLLCDEYEEQEVTSMKVEGGTVRVQIEPYAQVKDKVKFREWVLKQPPDEEGGETLAEAMSLPWPTTNSITKERLLAGLPEPDGVEAFQKRKVVLSRSK